MRLSQSEHNIKESLEQREITPSKNLWDNIQQELDAQEKPKKKYIFYRIASIAAVLCLAFLAYQGLTTQSSPVENYVIESKPIITTPVNVEAEPFTTSIVQTSQTEVSQITSADVASGEVVSDSKEKPTPVHTLPISLENNTDELLARAEAPIPSEADQIPLEDEINALLAGVTTQSKTKEQKERLNTLSADLLLAEAESEIDATKPTKLKDKVWGVLVANFNEMKQDLAFN